MMPEAVEAHTADRRRTVAEWTRDPLPPAVGRDWPENAEAESDQLAAYLSVHPEQLRRFVDRARVNAAAAHICWQANHEPILEQLERAAYGLPGEWWPPPMRWAPIRDGAPHVEAPAYCPFGDPTCPCPDGLACHYLDADGTPAMAPP